MLLWHDGLAYRSTTQLGLVYPSATGVGVGGVHPQFEKSSAILGSSSSLPIPVTPAVGTGSDTLFLGFRLFAAVLPSGTGKLLRVRNPSTSTLVTVRVVRDGSKLRIIVTSGDNSSLLIRSSAFEVQSASIYVELKIKTAVNGSAELRVNGVRDALIENKDTQVGFFSPWSQVLFVTDSSSGTLMISDVYLADGTGDQTFVGPVNITRIFAAQVKNLGWAPSLRSRKFLIVTAGQSNVNGRGSVVPYSGPLNPNLKVKLYYPTTGAPYTGVFADVVAGIGAHAFDVPVNPSIFWAFEMSLAEEISKLYELSGDTAGIEVYIVRMGRDQSSIIPLPDPSATWHPSIPGSLSIRGMEMLNTAVATAGGWGSFGRVDFFWYQGEAEALLAPLEPDAIEQFVPWTRDVIDYFDSQISIPISWHRMLVQTGLLEVFSHLEAVRAMQRSPLLPGSLIETDDLPIGPDGVNMSEAGQIELGKRAFRSWVVAQGFANDINDTFANFGESETTAPHWIGSNTLGSEVTFSQAAELQFDLLHTPVLALNNRMRRESTADGKRLTLTVGDVQMPQIVLDTAGAWTFKHLQMEGPFAPEQLTGDVKLNLS